jgi:predicted amidohydrolase
MTRIVRVAAAQLGPIARTENREQVVTRLITLLRQAAADGCDLVVYPEMALTTFFPHWEVTDPAELESYYEKAMPDGPVVRLFEEAARLKIGFSLGYAELAGTAGKPRHFNSSVLVGKDGRVIGKYRKIHLPGYAEIHPEHPFQNLEKMYFEVGDLGFPVFDAFGGTLGMCICNDRRWPETYRLLALQGAELITLGYNTPLHNPGQDMGQSPDAAALSQPPVHAGRRLPEQQLGGGCGQGRGRGRLRDDGGHLHRRAHRRDRRRDKDARRRTGDRRLRPGCLYAGQTGGI